MRLVLALLAFLVTAGAAAAEARVALVIGNDSYSEVPTLQKARNDAEAVAARLRATGFTVILTTDASRREMNRALAELAATARPGDVALFFYAGHGVEISGENFLLPVDIPAAAPGMEDFVREEAIGLSDVLDRIRGTGARLTIALVDACRDNPFATGTGRSVGRTRGLGRISAPEGTFVMFSAGAGQTALDRLTEVDPDPNSVFTRELLPLLSQPGLGLRDMAVTLRTEVNRLASSVAHRQTPAYYDELLGDFAFLPEGERPAGAGPEPEAPAPVDPVPDLAGTVREDYRLASQIGTAAAWEAFLAAHRDADPDGFHVALAEEALRVASATPPDGPPDGTGNGGTPPDGGGDAGGTTGVPHPVPRPETHPTPGDLAALTATARRFLEGDGVARDERQALALFTRAAASGQPEAMQWLGWMHQNGLGTRTDPATARVWYRRATDAGRPLAAYLLGRLVETGSGGPSDAAEAVRLYTRAAEGGEAVAMTALGHAHHRGIGTRTDPDSARRWYEKAIALGDSGAMYNLGEMHDSGTGVSRDGRLAAHWFHQSIGRGNSGALALMLRNAPRYLPQTWVEMTRLLAETGSWRGRADAGWGPGVEQALRAHLGSQKDTPVFWPVSAPPPVTGGRPGTGDSDRTEMPPRLAGRWSGEATQPGWGRFKVEVELSANGTGRTRYATLGCEGTLSFTGREGRAALFAEAITRERKIDCQGGTVHMTRTRQGISWLWHDASGTLKATATLTGQ